MNVVWCLHIFDTLTIQSILTGIGSPNETSQLNPIEMSMILGGAEIRSECGSKIIQRLISVQPIPTSLLSSSEMFASHECIRQ